MRRSQRLLPNITQNYVHSSLSRLPAHAPRAPRWSRQLVPRNPRQFGFIQQRFNSSVSDPSLQSQPGQPQQQKSPERKAWRPAPHRNPDEPVYEMYFTCKVCKHRSAHTISKQGYHAGTTLVKCPGCQNRHLISDHLKIFSDKAVTVEELLAQKGESIEKGTIDTDGDVEFWEDKATKGK